MKDENPLGHDAGADSGADSGSDSVPNAPATSNLAPLLPQTTPLNKVRLTLLVAMMFTLLVSGIFRTPPIVFMAAILCAAPVTAILLGKLSNRRLRVERTLPAVGREGDVLHGILTIENTSRWPALTTLVRAGQINQPFYGKASRASWPIIADAEGVHEVPYLAAYERLELDQNWHLRSRGIYQMPPARAGSIDPLGFAGELSVQSQPQELVVLPRSVRLERLGFIGGSAARMQAPQHASVVANAMDFHGVRPWQPGEAIRRIHWKSTARTGQLQIVEWEENVARDLALLLDTQGATLAGGGRENTLEVTMTIAASVVQHLLEGGYACQIFCWQEDSNGLQLVHQDARRPGDLKDALRLLAGIKPTEHLQASLPELSRRAAGYLPAGRATLLVASTLADISAARQPLLARSQAGGHCYTLALDAATFHDQAYSSGAIPADVFKSTRSLFNGTDLNNSLSALDSLSRLIRCGDPIAAALEQMA